MKIPKPTYDAKLVAAIEEYLDQDHLTEIEIEQEDHGLKYTYARGRVRKSYPRPMFQIIPDTPLSSRPTTPCQCDRFDRSWNCPEHPEIEWDAVQHRWKRPCTGDQERCQCEPCRERRTTVYTDMGTDGFRPPQGLIYAYQRMLMEVVPPPVEPVLTIRHSDRSYEATVLRDNREMQEAVMNQARAEALGTGWPVRGQVLGRWALIHADGRIIFEQRPEETIRYVAPFQEARPNDLNMGRPGYHYNFATDRWVPDGPVL